MKEDILYKKCNSIFFSAITLLVSILGIGIITIIAIIIEIL
jgi:hypothetical protein